MTRFTILSAIAAAMLVQPVAVSAQTQRGAPVPTTHVLAVGLLTGDRASPAVTALMPAEVKATAGLYLAGKLEQWWTQSDKPGVVFLLNATTLDQAGAMLADLPLVKAGLMKFDLTALGPLRPLQYLTDPPAK